MKRYFVDTSYLLAVSHTQDHWHERAVAWARVAQGRFWITDYVLLEFADAFASAPLRSRAVRFIDRLQVDTEFTIVAQSRELFQRGLELYRHRGDKDWSLTDCISFCVMSDEGLSDALTHDHHFEQAGFRALLRFDPPA